MQRDEPLTEREREVIDLMARGLTNGQIADELGISFATAKAHVSDIIGRLGVTSREEAVAAWRRRQSIPGGIRRTLATLAGLPMLAKAAATAVAGVGVAGILVAAGGFVGGHGGSVPLVVRLADLPIDTPVSYEVKGLGRNSVGNEYSVWLVHHPDDSVSAFLGRDPRTGCSIAWRADYALPPAVQHGAVAGTATPVSASLGAFKDPCSGSAFSRNGELVYGPTYRGLDSYAISITRDLVTVRFTYLVLGACNLVTSDDVTYFYISDLGPPYVCSTPGKTVTRTTPPPASAPPGFSLTLTPSVTP